MLLCRSIAPSSYTRIRKIRLWSINRCTARSAHHVCGSAEEVAVRFTWQASWEDKIILRSSVDASTLTDVWKTLPCPSRTERKIQRVPPASKNAMRIHGCNISQAPRLQSSIGEICRPIFSCTGAQIPPCKPSKMHNGSKSS